MLDLTDMQSLKKLTFFLLIFLFTVSPLELHHAGATFRIKRLNSFALIIFQTHGRLEILNTFKYNV